MKDWKVCASIWVRNARASFSANARTMGVAMARTCAFSAFSNTENGGMWCFRRYILFGSPFLNKYAASSIIADVLKIFKAKLYPNWAQKCTLIEYLDQARYVYNRCLADRRDAWQNRKETLHNFDQFLVLTQWRSEDARLEAVPALIERDAIRRVGIGFNGFFRGVKA